MGPLTQREPIWQPPTGCPCCSATLKTSAASDSRFARETPAAGANGMLRARLRSSVGAVVPPADFRSHAIAPNVRAGVRLTSSDGRSSTRVLASARTASIPAPSANPVLLRAGLARRAVPGNQETAIPNRVALFRWFTLDANRLASRQFRSVEPH
jgi:hypothetical protein